MERVSHSDIFRADDQGGATAMLESHDVSFYRTTWLCEKWGEDKIDFARRVLEREGKTHIQDGNVVLPHRTLRDRVASAIVGRDVAVPILVPRFIPISHGITSDELRRLGLAPDEEEFIEGNLLLQEGITRLTSLLIGAGGNAFNNANSYLGVGDSSTAEAATQTELQATQNAANRFYKAMVATYPQRSGGFSQTVDFRSDFTSTEANFVWNEWTASEGATTASGSGFLVGTTNLNRKVQSLGTKTTGTWTLTGSITFS